MLFLFLLLAAAIHNAYGFSINQRHHISTSTSLEATWSNGQAVKEYQDFLASGKQEIAKEADGPSVIVKSANQQNLIAHAIASLNNQDNDLVLTPASPLPATLGNREFYPIYVAIPPNELNDFIKNLPDDWKQRRDDFVFLSGGNLCGVIEPILKKYGLARDTMTQLLCGGFTTPDPSRTIGKPLDLSCKIGFDAQGEVKWAGETATCGKWAGAVQSRFETQGIRCKTGFYREWRRLMVSLVRCKART